MSTNMSIREPVKLKIGERYVLKVKRDNTPQVDYEDVSFITYTSSPEDIIVKTNSVPRLKVSRSDVYEQDGKK